MKKVNFFNFPSVSINVNNDTGTSKRISSTKNRTHIKITTFSSWCKSAKLKNEKFNVKVVFKAE